MDELTDRRMDGRMNPKLQSHSTYVVGGGGGGGKKGARAMLKLLFVVIVLRLR